MKPEIEKKIEYTIEVEFFEDLPIRGNAIDSGDAELDKQVEDELIERVENGDVWAWAAVKVKATIPGIALEGCDYLGGCSYQDEEDFKQDGYYENMCNEAKADLLKKLQDIEDCLKS